MKVCIISGTLPDLRCGVGDYAYRLCTELKKRNLEIIVITSQDPNVKSIEGIMVNPLIKKWGFSSLALLLRSIKKIAPDLVHIQYPTQAYKNKAMINFFPVFFKLIFPRVPLVVTIHDVKTAHILNKLRLVLFLFCAERIVLTTHEEEAYLAQRLPFLKDKFKIIHVGSNVMPHELPQTEKDKIRLSLGIKQGWFLIAHFGYILRKKKIEVVFYSLRRLLDEGQKVKLVLISSFYPQKDRYHARLEKLVDRLSLNQHVIWTGYCTQEEVSRYLFSSDICVQIYADGVSFRRTSFIAPLSHGLPIVTTYNGNLPKGLRDHDNILIAPPGDITKIVTAIKELLLCPDLRRKVGANIKLLSKYFSWDKIADDHFMLYEEMIGEIDKK